MKINSILVGLAAGALFACSDISTTTQDGPDSGIAKQALSRDPQNKRGVWSEPGIFTDGNPSTTDSVFNSYVVWDHNNFVVIGTFGALDLDLSLPAGSAPNSVTFWEYAIDADCGGNKKQIECEATESVYFVGNPTPLVQGFGWSFTKINDTNYAFLSQDAPPATGGAGSITGPVTDSATCLAALSQMRGQIAANGVNLHGKVGIDDSLCNGI